MERLLVYEHVPHETSGRFSEIVLQKGVKADVVKLWEKYAIPDFQKYSRLLVMGGPQSVYDPPLAYPSKDMELQTIRAFAQAGKPVLGICLGSQLIADAFGGKVYPNIIGGKPFKETGVYNVKLTNQGKANPLFKGFPESFPVFHWHGDVFDIPDRALLLATADEVPRQAFAHREKTFGVLFHLEMNQQMVEELIRIDNKWLHTKNEANEKVLLEEFRKNDAAMKNLGKLLFNNWLSL